jgi:hypothetical protein
VVSAVWNEMGQEEAAQVNCIVNEGMAGLVIHDQHIRSPPTKYDGANNQVSISETVDSGYDNRKSKKRMKKGKGAKAGLPKCLQFAEAVHGGKGGGRRKKRLTEVIQQQGDIDHGDDSILNENSMRSVQSSKRNSSGELLSNEGVTMKRG